MREDGRGAGAVTDDVAGSLRRLTKNLGAEVLFGVLEIDFLGDGDAVIADDRRPPALLDQDRFRLRAERDPHGVGEQRGAPQDLFAGGGMKQDLLVGHSLLLREIKSALRVTHATRPRGSQLDVARPAVAYFAVTGIVFCFFCASGDFGSVTVRTPLL